MRLEIGSTFSPFRNPLSRRGCGGGVDIKDDSEEILFQSFLQEALVRSSDMGRDVNSLICFY